LERGESVRNMSGEFLPLYKIKNGPSKGKIEEKKPVCEKRRNRIPEKVGSGLDFGKIEIRKGERKWKEWLRR